MINTTVNTIVFRY